MDLLQKVKEIMAKTPAIRKEGAAVINAHIEKIESYLLNPTPELWEEVCSVPAGRHTIEEWAAELGILDRMLTVEELNKTLSLLTRNLKKIIVDEEGKSLEAYIKFVITEPDTQEIIGIAFSGSLAACRAIHAAFYGRTGKVAIEDEITGIKAEYDSTRAYRRIEEMNGKVCHMAMLPRLAITEEYKEECIQADSAQRIRPNRILLSLGEDINSLAGQFLAQQYSLPKTKDWSDLYLKLLPQEKWTEFNVFTTDIAGEFLSLRALKIEAMQEKDILDIIKNAIQNGTLNVHSEIGTESAVFHENMSTEEYLRTNAHILATKIDEFLTPQYDGKTFLPWLGQTRRVCVPAQASAVMTVLTVLKKNNSAFLIGDMGTGKTQQSLTTAFSIMKERQKYGSKDGIRVLIVAPSITIPKWATSEIPEILGHNSTRTVVIDSTEDALAYVDSVRNGRRVPKGVIEFVLVSTDRMKLTANKFMLGAKWDRVREVWRCPDCGTPIMSPKAKPDEKDLLASWEDAVEFPFAPPNHEEIKTAKKDGMLAANGLPRTYIKRWTNKIRQFTCHTCIEKIARNRLMKTINRDKEKQIAELRRTDAFSKNALKDIIKDTRQRIIDMNEDIAEEIKKIKPHCSLARPAVKSRGEDRTRPRWMIAQIFQRMLRKHFHVMLFDEIQQMKASDSGRGMAFHKMLKAGKKALFLTGTLTNGSSTSLQATLWRSNPHLLLQNGFNYQTSKEVWATRYGVLERVTHRTEEGNVGRTTNRRQEKVTVKEKPGIAPILVTDYLLDKSVFVELPDLRLPLVELKEEPVIIPLEDDHNEAYQRFHKKLYDACQELQYEIGTRAWAKFTPSVLNYADQPHRIGYVTDNGEKFAHRITFHSNDGSLLSQVDAPLFSEDYVTAKERRLISIVKRELAEKRRCIIFTNFTGDYETNEHIQRVLKREGIDSEVLATDTCSSLGRFDWLEERKHSTTQVLIMNMRLVEVGLDLLEFPTLIYWQLSDNIDTLRQSSRRAWRIGQHRLCKVYYLINAGTQQMAQFQRLMSRRINALIVEGRIDKSDSLVKYAQDEGSKLTRDLAKCLSAAELTETWKAAAEKDRDASLEIVSEEEFQQRIKERFMELTMETKQLCGVENFTFEEEVPETNKDVRQDNEIADLLSLNRISLQETEVTPSIEFGATLFDFVINSSVEEKSDTAAESKSLFTSKVNPETALQHKPTKEKPKETQANSENLFDLLEIKIKPRRKKGEKQPLHEIVQVAFNF